MGWQFEQPVAAVFVRNLLYDVFVVGMGDLEREDLGGNSF